ncbi:MAG: 30S ribosomal protein S1 [Candidatus Omnitrophica bacterium]|nr:30S ribosomal protein S1 [Candidatus Omnitrophota bacterium]
MGSTFAELFEKSIQKIQEGEVVKGTVVEVRGNDIVVDIGYKAEGVLSKDEFMDADQLVVGSEVEVLFESFDDEKGQVVLSKRKADRQKTWNDLLCNAQEGTLVEGRVFRKVRGGFMVDIGMEAFLPASLVDVKPTRNLDQFLGLTSQFMIVKINHKRKNVVVSRKDYLDRERVQLKSKKLLTLNVGDPIKGKVKNITDFGVFLDLGDIDGLLHITDMSWGRISHPSEMVKLGDELDVVVISIDRDHEKVSLGLKQKSRDPWTEMDQKYSVGTQTRGRVVNILPYGVFVELEPGIEGLVHISELSWTKRVNHPSEILKAGDEVEALVLNLDKEAKKISLGIKQMQENPWVRVPQKYHVGDRVSGAVRNLTDYGVFIEIEPGVDGLVHISDISWTHKVGHPSEILKKGDPVQVMILSIDSDTKKISLGMKQLTEDPWGGLTKSLSIGTQLKGKITRVVNFGLFVQLENGLEGLIHISEIPGVTSADITKSYTVGDSSSVSILNVDHEARKIALTIREETPAQSS